MFVRNETMHMIKTFKIKLKTSTFPQLHTLVATSKLKVQNRV